MSTYDVFSTNSLDNHDFRENFKCQVPSKFEWDRQSSTTDAGYGSYCGSSFSLATSRYSTEEDNRMDKISLAPSMTSYHTARPYCPDPLPAVETKYQISPSTEVGSCALNYPMSIINEESYNRGLYDVKRKCERFDYYPEATRDDNYHVYTGKCKDDRLPYQPAIERSYWRLGPSVNYVGKDYSTFNIQAPVDTKCDKVFEKERRTTKEFYKEEAILEMERRQRSNRFWQSVHAEIHRKEEKKRMKKEEKEKKIADKKMKKENKKRKETKGTASNLFEAFKNKFSVKRKDANTINSQSTKSDNEKDADVSGKTEVAEGSDQSKHQSETNQTNEQSEKKESEKKLLDTRDSVPTEAVKDTVQSKHQSEKVQNKKQPQRKRARPEEFNLQTIEEENEEAETIYDGHPSLREVHGTVKTPLDEEIGIQSAFLLDAGDVDSAEKVGTQLTTQAVFRYLYWRVGKHNTELPDQRCALLHPSATSRNDAYSLSESMKENICFQNYENAKPNILLAPLHKGNHFALSIFEQDALGHIRVAVLDSMVGTQKMLTVEKAREIASNYFDMNRSSRVILEHSTPREVQIQEIESNDCGVLTIHNAERFLKHREVPIHNLLRALQSDFEIIDTSVRREAYGKQLSELIAEDTRNTFNEGNQDVRTSNERNDQENKENSIPHTSLVRDVAGTSKTKHNIHRFNKKRTTKRTTMEATRISRDSSVPRGRPFLVQNKATNPRSHKREKNLDTGVKRMEDKSIKEDNILLEKVLNVSEETISQLSQRDQTKLIQRIQQIVETTQKKNSTSLSSPSESSVDSPLYSPVKTRRNHAQKELTFDQKKTLVDLYYKKGNSLERLITRFNLVPDVKAARIQIYRISKEVENKKPNRLQATRLLRNRVQSLIKYKDDELMEEIHGADIQRTAIEQSVCFGCPNFRASSGWLHSVKKEMGFTSRHIDTRIVKASSNKQKDLEDTINNFLNNVVPDIKRNYDPDHIYNVDQTGLQYELKTNRTLTKKGRKKVERVVQRKNALTHSFTVNPCISASGKLIGRTFVTLKEPNAPRSFRRMVAPFRKLYITHTTSGKMTSLLSKEWLEKVFLPNVKDNSVLLLDSWAGFNQMRNLPILTTRNIKVVVFPEGTTSRLQPLDLSFNRQLKHFLKILENRIRSHHPNLPIGKREILLSILSFTVNQFQAARFGGLIQQGFDTIGLLTTPHQPYETPSAYCFNLKTTAGNICVPMNRGVYQDQQRIGPIQRAMQGILNDDGPGPSPRVIQQPPEEARKEIQEDGAIGEGEAEKEDEDEEEDVNLMQQMGKSSITPCPQLDKFLRYIKIGFFLSTIEVLMDNGSEDVETIRKEAKKKWHKLLESTGDGEAPDRSGLCGSAKIVRETTLMAKHTDYIAELLVKFFTDFDGSTVKLNKIRKATGYIRGLMVFDTTRKIRLYNNLSETIPGNFDQDLDIFKNNAVIFIEYLRTYQENYTPVPKCLALLLPNE